VLLQHFWFKLSEDASLQLDALSEGSFLLKDPTEGKEILDYNQETTPLIDLHKMPHQEESALSNRGLPSVEFELSFRLYLKFC
jgi:hypothetical protein